MTINVNLYGGAAYGTAKNAVKDRVKWALTNAGDNKPKDQVKDGHISNHGLRKAIDGLERAKGSDTGHQKNTDQHQIDFLRGLFPPPPLPPGYPPMAEGPPKSK